MRQRTDNRAGVGSKSTNAWNVMFAAGEWQLEARKTHVARKIFGKQSGTEKCKFRFNRNHSWSKRNIKGTLLIRSGKIAQNRQVTNREPLRCRAFVVKENMWTVPWSLVAQSREASWEKLMLEKGRWYSRFWFSPVVMPCFSRIMPIFCKFVQKNREIFQL